jgi:hypothetical protein
MTRGGFGARSDVTLVPAPLGLPDAACRDRADLLPAWDMKDPGDKTLPPDLAAMVSAARAVCSGCRGLIQCGDHALRVGEPMGVWGGLDPAQRRALRRAAGLA